MDLFQHLGIRLLSWEDNMKYFSEEDNKDKDIKEATLKNNEIVFFIEVKKIEEFTPEHFLRLSNLMKNSSINFLKLKYLLVKDEENFFFCYERSPLTLLDYFHKNEVNYDKRLLIYKQVIEIVYILKLFGEDFAFFEHNFFFIQDKDFFTNKAVILKLLYHGINYF